MGMSVEAPLCKVCKSRHWGMAHKFGDGFEAGVEKEEKVVEAKVWKGGRAEKKPKPAASEVMTGSALKEKIEASEPVVDAKAARAVYMREYMAKKRAADRAANGGRV